MEKLKLALADKIFDISSSGGEDTVARIAKADAFRNFATALEPLMAKYPAIETELIRMVQSGDFDTRVASSRVNAIISNELADSQPKEVIEEAIVVSEEEAYCLPADESDAEFEDDSVAFEEIPAAETAESPEPDTQSVFSASVEVESTEGRPKWQIVFFVLLIVAVCIGFIWLLFHFWKWVLALIVGGALWFVLQKYVLRK